MKTQTQGWTQVNCGSWLRGHRMSWRIFSSQKRTEGLLTGLGGSRPTTCSKRAIDRALLLQHNRTSVLRAILP